MWNLNYYSLSISFYECIIFIYPVYSKIQIYFWFLLNNVMYNFYDKSFHLLRNIKFNPAYYTFIFLFRKFISYFQIIAKILTIPFNSQPWPDSHSCRRCCCWFSAWWPQCNRVRRAICQQASNSVSNNIYSIIYNMNLLCFICTCLAYFLCKCSLKLLRTIQTSWKPCNFHWSCEVLNWERNIYICFVSC